MIVLPGSGISLQPKQVCAIIAKYWGQLCLCRTDFVYVQADMVDTRPATADVQQERDIQPVQRTLSGSSGVLEISPPPLMVCYSKVHFVVDSAIEWAYQI